MKQQKAPKPRIIQTSQQPSLPEIKKQPTSQIQQKQAIKQPQNPLSLSRVSRQSSSIETTISQESQRKQSQPKKVEQLMKNKTTFNHRSLMNDYLKRQNVSIATKVFCFNSQDEYIRRCLAKHGWIETSCNSQFFDLKWVYTENQDDFRTILDGQFYNHFKNTKELTTKSCLLSNFKQQCEYGYDTSQFFPRAFDLGNATDREDFLKEYERTAVTIIVKKCVIQLKLKRKDYMKELKQKIHEYWKEKQTRKAIQRIDVKRTVKRKYKNIYTSQELESQVQSDVKFDISVLSEVLSRMSDMKRQLQNGFYDDKNFELSSQYVSRTRQNLISYSQLQKFEKGVSPSDFLIRKLYSYHLFFKKHDPTYKVDGIHNIWIIKPGGCARGQGIYLENILTEIINSGLQMQDRLVQKYIERPLLYKNYKFDLRQWVLVKSFQPLQAYVFSHCYMRMCSQSYDIKDIKNLLKHLTNFSLNKSEFKKYKIIKFSHNDSIYSSDFMQSWLPIDWLTIVRPQCNELMIKTLKILQEQFEGETKYCFELYGFDIMLDEYCKPWLLEVNLSPACAERADWLHEMLDNMAESMFNIIFGEEFKSPKKYYYEVLIDEELTISSQLPDTQIEIWGQKCNLKREKMIDKRYVESLAALMIQKFYRMYKAKKIKWFLRDTKHAIVIQKYARRWLAKQMKTRIKNYNSARKIQTLIRGFIARRQKYHLKRNKMAIIIQCRVRQNIAKSIKFLLEEELALMTIYELFRMKKAIKIANEQKIKLKKYQKIQRWWKLQYRSRCTKSSMMTKFVKGFLQRKRYQKLLSQHKAAIVIQKNYKSYKAVQLRKQLTQEHALLILQNLFRIKLAAKKLRLSKVQDGLAKFWSAYGEHKKRVALVQIWNIGLLRNSAIMKIQSYRMVIKSKRYLKRLKRLKKFIKLQAFVKGFLQRKRFLKLIKRRRAVKIIIKAIRKYIFKKKIRRRIIQKRKRDIPIMSQQASKQNTIQQITNRNSQTISQIPNRSNQKIGRPNLRKK